MIQDTFGRVHDYLRISLTDACNLRCSYCMPDESHAFSPSSRLMQSSEIEYIARLFVDNGVRKIRLTGGEPLVRKDAPKIISSLGELGIELSITTNGALVHEMLCEIVQANIKAINVSLDTLEPGKFMKITRRDLYHRVKSNIDLLLQHNICVKINVVVMKGLNDDEILDFVALTKHKNIEVRFIEFMPFSGNKWTDDKVFTMHEILMAVASKYDAVPVATQPNDTSKRYRIPGHVGSFAVISTMSEPFCDTCNRMRLTADGKLKNCLFSPGETDLLGPLRQGREILPLIQETIIAKAKALGGQFGGLFQDIDAATLKNRSMIKIGG